MKRVLMFVMILGLVVWVVPALAQEVPVQGADNSSNTIEAGEWAVGVTQPEIILQGALALDAEVTIPDPLAQGAVSATDYVGKPHGQAAPVKQQAATGNGTVTDNSGQDQSNKGLWDNDDNIIQTQLPFSLDFEKKGSMRSKSLLEGSGQGKSRGNSSGGALYNQMAADDGGTIGVDLRNAKQRDGNNVAGDNEGDLTSWKNDDGVQVGNDVGDRNLMGEMKFKEEAAINTGSMDRSVMVGDEFDEEAAINTGTFTGLQAGDDIDDETAVNTGTVGERAINAGKVEVEKGGWLITGTAGMENSFNKVKSGKAPVAYSTGDDSPAMAVEDCENPNFQSNAGNDNVNLNHVDNSAAVREIEKETKIEFKVKDFGASTVNIGFNDLGRDDGEEPGGEMATEAVPALAQQSDNCDKPGHQGRKKADCCPDVIYMNKSAIEVHKDYSKHNIAKVENEAEVEDDGAVFNNSIQTVAVSELRQVNSGVVAGDYIMNTSTMAVDSSVSSIEGAVAMSYSQGGVSSNTASANVINVTANTDQTNNIQIPIDTQITVGLDTTVTLTEAFNNNGPFVPLNSSGTVINGTQTNHPG